MGPRSLEDDLAYGERWDKDRFLAERDRERDRIEERDRFRVPPVGRPRNISPDRPERRAVSSRPPWEDEPRRPRRFPDDDSPRFRPSPPPELERDIALGRRLVIDREKEYRKPSPPRRPGMMIRRQSSLDTFDRRPLARFHEKEEYGPPARRTDYRPEPYEPIPLPRSRRLPPPRIYAERDYDEIKISEPDRYGNEEYHGFPERMREREIEREITRSKRRRSGSRTSRSRTHRSSPSHRSSSRTSTSSSSSSSSNSARTTVTVKSEYPKKGKTRIPARLVSTRALIDLGYPFIQENNTIIVQKALGQDNIDDVLKLSEDYKKAETEVNAARSSHVAEDRREEIYTIPPPPMGMPPQHMGMPPPHMGMPPQHMGMPPPMTPQMATAPPPPPPAFATPGPPPAEVFNQTMVYRESSPSSRSTRSRRSHSVSTSTSRRTPVVVDAHPWETSSEVPVGPLALVADRHRSDRDIKMEIAQLEAERDLVRRERHHHHHHSHSHSHSHSSHSPGRELMRAERLPTGELVVYEQEVERIEEPRRGARIEKDKKGPPPGLMRAMLATLT